MPGPTVVYLQLFLKNDTYLGVGRGMGGGGGGGLGMGTLGKVKKVKAYMSQRPKWPNWLELNLVLLA